MGVFIKCLVGGAPGVWGRWSFVMGYSISVLLESELGSHFPSVRSKSKLFAVRVGLCQDCHLSTVLSIIFMDRVSRRSQVAEGVKFGDLWIPSLLFTDDVVLFASSHSDLQLSLGHFAARC